MCVALLAYGLGQKQNSIYDDDDSFAAAWPAVRASLALVISSDDAESLSCSYVIASVDSLF